MRPYPSTEAASLRVPARVHNVRGVESYHRESACLPQNAAVSVGASRWEGGQVDNDGHVIGSSGGHPVGEASDRDLEIIGPSPRYEDVIYVERLGGLALEVQSGLGEGVGFSSCSSEGADEAQRFEICHVLRMASPLRAVAWEWGVEVAGEDNVSSYRGSACLMVRAACAAYESRSRVHSRPSVHNARTVNSWGPEIFTGMTHGWSSMGSSAVTRHGDRASTMMCLRCPGSLIGRRISAVTSRSPVKPGSKGPPSVTTATS